MYHWSQRSTLGASIKDINQPNIALDLRPITKLFREPIASGILYEADRHLTLGFGSLMSREELSNNERDTVRQWTGSAEKLWKLEAGDQVSVRGSIATGSREFQQAALGAGYLINQIQIDYAFVFNVVGITPGATAGTHRFSLTYRFGKKGTPAKAKVLARRHKTSKMPEGYEQTTHIPEEAAAENPSSTYQGPLPRAVDLTITPEDIGEYSVPTKASDVSIEVIFDSDYDGVPDDKDLCPNTPPGMDVDANGCSSTQVDHHGNPLPHQVSVDNMSLDEVEHGR